jgi:hypothetical protein
MDGLYALNVFTQRLRGFMDRAAVQGTSPDALTVLGMSGPMAAIIGVAVAWWTVSVLWLAVRLSPWSAWLLSS